MANPNDLILISADDITLDEPVIVESDCACPEPDDRLLLPLPPPLRDDIPYRSPPHVTLPLRDGFHAACNALAGAGVVIHRQPILNFLDDLNTPRLLSDALQELGGGAGVRPLAERLARLRLIAPADGSGSPGPAEPQTLTAWLHVTNNCNLACPYCFVAKNKEHLDSEIGERAVNAIFRSAVAHGFRRVALKYAGGEPTLNFPHVLALHDHARRLAAEDGLQLRGVLLSNGTVMTRAMIDEMRKRELRLMISLDGIHEVHDRQRPFVNRRGSFAAVETTLNLLETEGFAPSISITVTRANLTALAATVAYVLDRGLPFTLNLYRENECSAGCAELAFDDESVIRAMRAAFAEIEARLPRASVIGALLDLARAYMPHAYACGAGHSYLVVNHRGGIAKCHMELDHPVAHVSAPDPLRLIQEDRGGLQNVPVDEKEGCRECPWRYWCAGGCPALTYRATGRFDIKSPNCRIYQALFPELVRLEGLRLLKYGTAQAA